MTSFTTSLTLLNLFVTHFEVVEDFAGVFPQNGRVIPVRGVTHKIIGHLDILELEFHFSA